MFIPALEYRKFVQKPRTIEEKQKKLTDLALKVKEKSQNSFKDILNTIVDSYRRGDDILDPDFFDQNEIEAFARQNKILNDPQVQVFIQKAALLRAANV